MEVSKRNITIELKILQAEWIKKSSLDSVGHRFDFHFSSVLCQWELIVSHSPRWFYNSYQQNFQLQLYDSGRIPPLLLQITLLPLLNSVCIYDTITSVAIALLCALRHGKTVIPVHPQCVHFILNWECMEVYVNLSILTLNPSVSHQNNRIGQKPEEGDHRTPAEGVWGREQTRGRGKYTGHLPPLPQCPLRRDAGKVSNGPGW